MNDSQCVNNHCSTSAQHGNMQNCWSGQQNDSHCSDGQLQCCPIEELVSVAKCAKKELLKEKIKIRLEKEIGDKLDQVADLAVEMMIECHKSKVAGVSKKEAIMQKFKAILSK